jgi:hypothetical protein
MLKIHHLGHSQSERIVWLCEELDIPYALTHHTRDAVTVLSPPELKALHPLGAAPVIEDGDVTLVARGYHPVAAVHGYDLYYLNTMAGPRRTWKFHNATEHEWLLK